MKQINFNKYLFTLLSGLCIGIALDAQNFKLIDINKLKSSNPSNQYHYSAQDNFAVLNNVFYFSADDGINGIELWRSDGTTGGTALVKDINPGSASSSPQSIIVSGGKLYFVASIIIDGSYQQQLWVSDGTSAGTKNLVNITDYQGTYLTDVNGILYFVNQYQLWKSDGTESGTLVVADFPSLFEYNPRQLVNVNGILFFELDDYSGLGTELYKSDGTAEGTTIVTDINPFGSSNPSHLTALNGLLYFAADDGTGGVLWVSDGSATGTHAVKNTNNIYLPIDGFGSLDPFSVINNTLYFQGSTTISGNELCKYNTSDAGSDVIMVKDIVPGENSSYPSSITNVNGTLFFTIGPAGADAELWKSDGTDAGTVLVKDINPGGNNFYNNLTGLNGILLFTFFDSTSGTELWKSDGTSAGTILLKDIFPGNLSSNPYFFTYNKGTCLFSAESPKGTELWQTDGTETGTRIVKDINQIATSSSYPSGFTKIPGGKKVIFAANDEINPGNLFVTDGSAAGTKPVNVPVTVRLPFINWKNNTYFLDYSNQLWKTDGTRKGTSILSISPFVNIDSGYVINMLATGDLLYIITYNYITSQYTLWRSDATVAGTYIIKSDIASYYGANPTAVNNTLFFVYYNLNTGFNELWKSNGTVAGTVVVKSIENINPLTDLYNFNGKLYFMAYTSINDYGYSLWTSDGTETGTYVVKEVAVVEGTFAQANGKLFFYALNTISKGYELYATDGTSSGTKIVKDINKGEAASLWTYTSLISGETILYFTADDGKHGPELWKSDGTKQGTKLVKDITNGINGTAITNMVNVKDKVYFTINDTLWFSDGTKRGTNPVTDENLRGVSQYTGLTAIGDSLYFSGYTYAAGQELYLGSVDANNTKNDFMVSDGSFSAIDRNDLADALSLKLSPNPVNNILHISTNGLQQNKPSTISLVSSSGAIVKTIQPGTLNRNVQLDVSSIASGIYIVKVVNGDKTIYKQFIKL